VHLRPWFWAYSLSVVSFDRSVGCIGPRVYEIQATDYGTACRCSSVESCGLEYEIRDLAWMGNQRYVAGIK
jgi:hypothetical protein